MRNDLSEKLPDGRYVAEGHDDASVFAAMGVAYVHRSDLEAKAKAEADARAEVERKAQLRREVEAAQAEMRAKIKRETAARLDAQTRADSARAARVTELKVQIAENERAMETMTGKAPGLAPLWAEFEAAHAAEWASVPGGTARRRAAADALMEAGVGHPPIHARHMALNEGARRKN